MLWKIPVLVLLACVLLCTACADRANTGESRDKMRLPPIFAKLLPLHTKLGKPKPGEWLSQHPEPGQTYQEYIDGRPVTPERRRGVIYVQPLGDFTRTKRKIIDLTAEFMGIYFNLPVKTQEDLPLKLIPEEARRTHPEWGDPQILTTYVLYDVLRPRLPKDACAYIAFTASDLWPGRGWNFVFGQASLSERVGVWSIYRNGNPDESAAALRLCLLRTIKTATHETGHMFSMEHCTLFECNMCGSNHRAESDSRPLALCPHCLAKLCYATSADPEKRFERLIAFCKAQGLKGEQEFYEKSLATLRKE
jgi:archaemetzincin